MTNRKSGLRAAALVAALMLAGLAASPGRAADEPDLIFRRSTVFKWLTPNDKLATYGLDDPEVDGVACHFTVPEKGGLKGWLGVAEEVFDGTIGTLHKMLRVVPRAGDRLLGSCKLFRYSFAGLYGLLQYALLHGAILLPTCTCTDRAERKSVL